MRQRLLFLIPLFALLSAPVFAACGGDDDDGGGGDSPFGPGDSGDNDDDDEPRVPQTRGGGECEVNVTGDVTVSWKGDGGVEAVGTEYWMSDDEIREVLEFGATGTDEEKKQQVEEGMAKDPRIYLLLVNCVSSESASQSLSLAPSNSATSKDLPFGPGEYAIPAGGSFGGADDPKHFSALLGTGGDELWRVSEEGVLEITKWDNEGIAGEFSFKATEGLAEGEPKEISVEGSFDFDCTFGEKCD